MSLLCTNTVSPELLIDDSTTKSNQTPPLDGAFHGHSTMRKRPTAPLDGTKSYTLDL